MQFFFDEDRSNGSFVKAPSDVDQVAADVIFYCDRPSEKNDCHLCIGLTKIDENSNIVTEDIYPPRARFSALSMPYRVSIVFARITISDSEICESLDDHEVRKDARLELV